MPLGQRRLAGADREMHRARARQLLGDLEAGVAAADHERRPVGQLVRVSDSRLLCSCTTSPSRPPAIGGVNGTWKGPVATTTWSAS